jgi:hypothetical protein
VKSFTSRIISFVFIFLAVTLLLMFSLTPVMASTGSDVVKGILISLIGSPVVQGALIFILLGMLAYLFRKNVNAWHVINMAILAYEYAEKKGLAQKLNGYQKFDPFMDQFITAYKEKYGTDPNPAEKGLAVKTMEQKVLGEHLPGK